MKKVCTVGSATQDIFIMYEGTDTMYLHQKKSRCTYMLLQLGTKVDIPALHYATGGGATNTASGFKHLGLSTNAFFRTGNDAAGKYIRKVLADETINIQHCPLDSLHDTALSLIIPSLEKDHVAFCYRGANRYQRPEDFPVTLLADLDLIFIGPLGGVSQDLFPYIALAAHAAHVPVALNPSMIQLTKNTEPFLQALQYVDTLIVNTYESGYLMKVLGKESQDPCYSISSFDKPALLYPFLSFGNQHYTLQDIIKKILSHGPKTIIITNGAEGVYVATNSQIFFHPSIDTDPVYSLGAGDAFSSAFLGTRILGSSLQQALVYGIINASSVIQYPDAKKGLLSFAELESRAHTLSKNNLYREELLNNPS